MNRFEALEDLVRLRRPVAEAIAQMRSFPWDADEELVTLGPTELRGVLRRFLDGQLTPDQLEDWANAVEGREDIAFEPPMTLDLVSELANPALHRTLTPENVHDILTRLDSQQSASE